MDFLRGLSLLSIFVDHIPKNVLADYTIHMYGFSDAAELFVFLAGFSATAAYRRVFDRDGLKVGLSKVLARCVKIYGVQLVLLLSTILVVSAWDRHFGTRSVILGPMLRDGLKGTLRGVTLEALPTYLDILPLYIVMLAAFPLVRFGLARSVSATVAASAALWLSANVFGWDLPSMVDPDAVTRWYFNPFTWQLVFVLGAAFAAWTQQGAGLLVRPSRAMRTACWAYLAFAFVTVDAWHLWPAPLSNFPSTDWPFAILGNEPKSFVTPWRLAHILAVAYLALTSERLRRFVEVRVFEPVLACGRQSLYVFAVGCMLALFGRLIFKTAGVTPVTEVLVNACGLSIILAAGVILDRLGRTSGAQERAPQGRAPASVPAAMSPDAQAGFSR